MNDFYVWCFVIRKYLLHLSPTEWLGSPEGQQEAGVAQG